MEPAMKILLAAAVTSGHGLSEHQHAADDVSVHSLSSASVFVREMDAGMKKMMDDMHAPGYSGNPDVDFLAMMIPHHQGAVEMARLLLIHGQDPMTRRIAEEIVASQTAEIAAMNERLKILRRGDDPEPGGFPALHGTRGLAPK
jgi:uncharacterized protein (DUF305 family)